MKKSERNLNKLMASMGITNIGLAKGINVDTSLVSRWKKGERQLKMASATMDKLADYMLDRAVRANKTEWLREQMEADGLLFDYSAADSLLAGLKLWLSSDGDEIGKTLNLFPAEYTKGDCDRTVKTGYAEIAFFFDETAKKLRDGSKLDIHLSSEDMGILLHESISGILLDAMAKKGCQIRLLVSMSSVVMAMSRLLNRYTQAMIAGSLNMAVVHGMTQAITNQATFIFEDELIFIVCETPKNIVPPIGMPAYEESFIRESKKSFERAYNYSQELLRRYDDNVGRNVLEIIFSEFATPGDLDIIKDSINPVYMAAEPYDNFLKIIGYEGDQYEWRMAESHRCRDGMNANFGGGTVFREIISQKRIDQILADGYCQMPGLYFFGTGMVKLYAEGCLSIFQGYIDYLDRYPNFHLLILDEISELSEKNCWHIKQNSHWMLNGWNKDEHIILHTDQLMLTHEFQTRYDTIWNKSQYSGGRREQTKKILRESIRQLKETHLDKSRQTNCH